MQRDIKKILSGKTLALFAAALVLVASGCTANVSSDDHARKPYPSVEVDMKLVRVSEHVYFVQGKAGTATQNKGFISNAGFVVTKDGVVVFDALGTPSLAQKLLGYIRSVTKAPIKKVVMSHYHADHLYGLQVFKDEGAQIIAPAGAIDYLSSDVADSMLASRRKELKPWVDERTRIVPADIYLHENMDFKLGGIRFRLSLQGMAHSEGDLAMLVEPDQVLFTGDIIFEGRIPFIGETNTKNWLQQLDRLRQVKVAALIPGHGPLARDPNKLVKFTYGYLSFLREEMGKAAEHWMSFDKAYDQVNWSEYEFTTAFLEANRRNAYNVFLAMEKESFD